MPQDKTNNEKSDFHVSESHPYRVCYAKEVTKKAFLHAGCLFSGVIPFLRRLTVDEVTDGAGETAVLLVPQLFVVAVVVGRGHDVGIEVQFHVTGPLLVAFSIKQQDAVGSVLEIAKALDVVADVAGVFRRIEIYVYVAGVFGHDEDGQLVARCQAAARRLYALNNHLGIAFVDNGIGYLQHLPLLHGVIVAYGVCADVCLDVDRGQVFMNDTCQKVDNTLLRFMGKQHVNAGDYIAQDC